MKRVKKVALILPEYLLIGAVIFYWFSSAMALNPLAIALLLVLGLQLIFKNRIVGIIIPSFLTMACLYMLLALMSEFHEFPTFNADAQQLLVVGLLYFLSTIVVSGLMIYKYATMETKTGW